MKILYDPIHKYMRFDSLLMSIIDTPEFQRLRNIKQLGLCYYVFPGACHNRFEHSLGVCHLSGLLIKNLQKNQPELGITNRDVQLVKIAGLVHDLGHACFSHFFDHHFLKSKLKKGNPNIEHEYRSIMLFNYIINKYDIPITPEECKIIEDMINPQDDNLSFKYQIVANKRNGLDCDKFDYIARDTYNIGLSYSFDSSRLIMYAKVIDDIICYPEKCYSDIFDLYYTRYKLFKQIYTHPCVRAVEFMVLDVLNLSDEKFKLSEQVNDIEKFIKLTDNILDIIDYCDTLTEERKIIFRIKIRELYKLVADVSNRKFNMKKFKSIIKKKI